MQVLKSTKSTLRRFIFGVLLWQQAVRGKLSFQFLCAILLDIAVAGILLHWHLTPSWQTLFRVAFFLNTIFYIAFPLLLFLGQWFQQRMQKPFFKGSCRRPFRQAIKGEAEN